MKKYIIDYQIREDKTIIVEAEDEEDAEAVFQEEVCDSDAEIMDIRESAEA